MQPPFERNKIKKNRLRDRRKRHAMAQFDGFDLVADTHTTAFQLPPPPPPSSFFNKQIFIQNVGTKFVRYSCSVIGSVHCACACVRLSVQTAHIVYLSLLLSSLIHFV